MRVWLLSENDLFWTHIFTSVRMFLWMRPWQCWAHFRAIMLHCLSLCQQEYFLCPERSASCHCYILLFFFIFIFIFFHIVYFGYHYLSDIVIVVLLGVSITAFFNYSAVIKNNISKWILPFSKDRPALFYSLFFFVTYQIADLFWGSREIITYIHKLYKHQF